MIQPTREQLEALAVLMSQVESRIHGKEVTVTLKEEEE